MKPFSAWTPWIATLLLTAPVSSENLTRVRVDAPNAPELAARLEAEGHDVLEGSVSSVSLELVVTDQELLELQEVGLSPVVLEVGRPLLEKLEEAGEGPDVPAGYPDLADVIAEMQATQTNFPAIAQLVNLTTTYGTPQTWEGRDLYALKISDNVAVDEDEPAFLMVSAHHCREIVTPVLALDAIERLTTGYASDPQIQAFVDGNEIWIAPVWNPDGYDYVFTTQALWRKNRRVFAQGVGVDLNRNYPFGWSAPCSGSSNPSSDTYKGPSPASEAETQTLMALTNDVRFAKVLDYHSSGREVLWEYSCNPHPFGTFLRSEAIALSNASGYNGAQRPPSAEGEQYEWQVARGVHAFLTETHTSFQPSYASAQAEAATVWPGTVWFLERPISLWGHVTDSSNGNPLNANIAVSGLNFVNGEELTSGGDFGRYDLTLPEGNYNVTFSAFGYQSQVIPVMITGSSSQLLDVALMPGGGCPTASTTFRNGSGINPSCLTSLTPPALGTTWQMRVDASSVPTATETVVQARKLPGSGIVLAAGEILMNLSSTKIFGLFGPVSSGQTVHTFNVPPSPELAGFTMTIQGGIFAPGMGLAQLCNAEDVVVGCP